MVVNDTWINAENWLPLDGLVGEGREKTDMATICSRSNFTEPTKLVGDAACSLTLEGARHVRDTVASAHEVADNEEDRPGTPGRLRVQADPAPAGNCRVEAFNDTFAWRRKPAAGSSTTS